MTQINEAIVGCRSRLNQAQSEADRLTILQQITELKKKLILQEERKVKIGM
jgi:hypothetical protein